MNLISHSFILSPTLSRWSPWIACTAGAFTVFAFAPFGWWPLQIFTLALLFLLVLQQTSIKHAVFIGWSYSFGWMLAGVHWLYISMHHYGGMPAVLAALAVVLLSAILALYSALAMAGVVWYKQRRATPYTAVLLLVVPALWTLSEWARGWVFTGFPWIASGYAHSASPLSGFAPVIGVYGLGWISAFIAACLSWMLLNRTLLPLIPITLMFALGLGLKNIDWTTAHGQPISVRLLQGNVPQEIKFERQQIIKTLDLYYEMISAAPADLIVTPETALPVMAQQLPESYLNLLLTRIMQSKSHLILGIPISDGPEQYVNSVLGFAPITNMSSPPYRYDKHHLVPFGEFIPTGARWFVNLMNIPLGDFTRGALLQAPFAVKDQLVLPNICYEDLFGEEIADQLAASHFADKPSASILLNVSNIAWFGDSIALPQHLQISQMRSLETGRPMLRATNTGVTAVIDAKGNVQAQLPPFTRGDLSAKVQGMAGWTPYILFGNTLVVALALIILGGIWFIGRKKMNSPVASKTR